MTILGETQWNWLEEQMQQPADLRIIGSSIQLLANEHRFEKWGLFDRERTRMIGLLQRSDMPTLVISGDRHHGEISVMPTPHGDLVELTSSSLNSPGRWKNERNPYRVGDKFHEANFGLISIDWTRRRMSLQVLSDRGIPMIQHDVPLQRRSADE